MKIQIIRNNIRVLIGALILMLQFVYLMSWVGAKPIELLDQSGLKYTEVPQNAQSFQNEHGEAQFSSHGIPSKDPSLIVWVIIFFVADHQLSRLSKKFPYLQPSRIEKVVMMSSGAIGLGVFLIYLNLGGEGRILTTGLFMKSMSLGFVTAMLISSLILLLIPKKYLQNQRMDPTAKTPVE